MSSTKKRSKFWKKKIPDLTVEPKELIFEADVYTKPKNHCLHTLDLDSVSRNLLDVPFKLPITENNDPKVKPEDFCAIAAFDEYLVVGTTKGSAFLYSYKTEKYKQLFENQIPQITSICIVKPQKSTAYLLFSGGMGKLLLFDLRANVVCGNCQLPVQTVIYDIFKLPMTSSGDLVFLLKTANGTIWTCSFVPSLFGKRKLVVECIYSTERFGFCIGLAVNDEYIAFITSSHFCLIKIKGDLNIDFVCPLEQPVDCCFNEEFTDKFKDHVLLTSICSCCLWKDEEGLKMSLTFPYRIYILKISTEKPLAFDNTFKTVNLGNYLGLNQENQYIESYSLTKLHSININDTKNSFVCSTVLKDSLNLCVLKRIGEGDKFVILFVDNVNFEVCNECELNSIVRAKYRVPVLMKPPTSTSIISYGENICSFGDNVFILYKNQSIERLSITNVVMETLEFVKAQKWSEAYTACLMIKDSKVLIEDNSSKFDEKSINEADHSCSTISLQSQTSRVIINQFSRVSPLEYDKLVETVLFKHFESIVSFSNKIEHKAMDQDGVKEEEKSGESLQQDKLTHEEFLSFPLYSSEMMLDSTTHEIYFVSYFSVLLNRSSFLFGTIFPYLIEQNSLPIVVDIILFLHNEHMLEIIDEFGYTEEVAHLLINNVDAPASYFHLFEKFPEKFRNSLIIEILKAWKSNSLMIPLLKAFYAGKNIKTILDTTVMVRNTVPDAKLCPLFNSVQTRLALLCNIPISGLMTMLDSSYVGFLLENYPKLALCTSYSGNNPDLCRELLDDEAMGKIAYEVFVTLHLLNKPSVSVEDCSVILSYASKHRISDCILIYSKYLSDMPFMFFDYQELISTLEKHLNECDDVKNRSLFELMLFDFALRSNVVTFKYHSSSNIKQMINSFVTNFDNITLVHKLDVFDEYVDTIFVKHLNGALAGLLVKEIPEVLLYCYLEKEKFDNDKLRILFKKARDDSHLYRFLNTTKQIPSLPSIDTFPDTSLGFKHFSSNCKELSLTSILLIPEIVEFQFQLLCESETTRHLSSEFLINVTKVLKNFENVLIISQNYNCVNCQAYVSERMGDVKTAKTLRFEMLSKKFENLKTLKTFNCIYRNLSIFEVELMDVCKFCIRHSEYPEDNIPNGATFSLWIELISLLLLSFMEIKYSIEHNQSLRKKHHKAVEKWYSTQVSALIQRAVPFTTNNLLLEEVFNRFSQMSLPVFLPIINGMLVDHNEMKNMTFLVNKLLANDISSIHNANAVELKKGVFLSNTNNNVEANLKDDVEFKDEKGLNRNLRERKNIKNNVVSHTAVRRKNRDSRLKMSNVNLQPTLT
eukprot:TRINITY_DN3264_c0_g2_i1.p1 TRINITY_DN3264_c0_g2~~TRINITY_DN3264_c0_g2_i1.p1  ORF type:complete len:1324 (+),score=263.93 TRINITY_DN3264_c0_g2_i1:513-4484(+)